MKSLIVVAVAAFVLSLSACDNGADGTIESCATSLVGTFEGTSQGGVTALLAFDTDAELWKLTVTFLPDGEEELNDGTSDVDETTGELTPEPNPLLKASGTIDFSDGCTVDGGMWTRGDASGTWQAALR